MTDAADASPRHYRLGIDVGGTFTDLTLLEPKTGHLLNLKTPTVPQDPVAGILRGLGLLAGQGVRPEEIGYFVHGTTTGLNTLLQRSGARTALFVTEGFRDLLALQRLRLPVPYDFHSRLPEPLVPRKWVFPVSERIDAAGAVVRPLDLASLDGAIDGARAAGVEGVAVCFLHSYKNDRHERAVADRIRERAPGLHVSLSSALWPQMREYERAVVATANLYIQPTAKRYFEGLKTRLREQGVPATPYVTQSNGGIMTLDAAAAAPVRTLFSGPAAGVIGAVRAARSAGIANVMTFDMGGTSADIAIVEDGEPGITHGSQLAGLPIMLPTIGISSIGAGGGSVPWIDPGGLLKVGPESVGSDPGPACYGRGERPALSDAFLLCGYLSPRRFAAGRVTLYPERSQAALEPLARYLGLDVHLAADRVVQVAIANMYAELTSLMEQRGFDPRDFHLLAFGGAGPVTANFLANEVNAKGVLVPPSPGTLCALGALTADFAHDAVRSRQVFLHELGIADLRAELADLAEEAKRWLAEQAVQGLLAQELLLSLDLRCRGQSFEIELPLDPAWLEAPDTAAIAQAFHAQHQRQYGHSDPQAVVELVNLRAKVIGHTPKPPLREVAAADGPAVPVGRRLIWYRGNAYEAAVYSRTELLAGHLIDGPAIVEQDDTTVLILDRWQGSVDRYGNLQILRQPGALHSAAGKEVV